MLSKNPSVYESEKRKKLDFTYFSLLLLLFTDYMHNYNSNKIREMVKN
jgi:hypothetical protein